MAELPGHRRRVIIRRLVGKPGSVRRWLLANLIVLPLVFASLNLYLIIAAVLFSTMWIMYLRTMLVEGDEDELSAWVRWQYSRKNPNRVLPGEETEPVDSTDWFNHRSNTFIDAPPPPILDEAEGSQDSFVGIPGDCVCRSRDTIAGEYDEVRNPDL